MFVVDLSTIRKNKTLLLGILIVLFLMLALLPGDSSKQQVVWVTGKNARLLPIYGVDSKEKKIAMSFDATWGASETPKILAILKKYNIKTTFFLVNLWLSKYPDVAKKISQEGHEIGMHSATHPYFTQLSNDEIKKQIQDNRGMIYNITGQSPNIFRPPYGDYNNRVIAVLNEMNVRSIQWSVDSLDWKDLSANVINQRVFNKIRPGGVILFHNSGKHTAEALETIIPELLKQGYEIVPVSQLLIKDNYAIDNNGIQYRK